MKKIEKTITTSKTIYQAIDGAQFESEQSCKDWESRLQCTINAAWNKIPKTEIPFCDLFWSGCDDDILVIVKPRDIEDVKIINMQCNLSEKECLTQEDIGREITFIDYCGDYCKQNTPTPFKDMLADIDKCKKIAAEDIKNYGYYEVKLSSEDKADSTNGYSLYRCINSAKYIVRRWFDGEGIQEKTITLNIFKDGEFLRTETYTAEYNKADWQSFKFEKDED